MNCNMAAADRNKKCGFSGQGGFTMIEFIIAIAVMALIAVSIAPALSDYRLRYLENERAANEGAISNAIRQCYALEGRYPPVLGDTGLDYVSDNYGIILKPQEYIYEYRIVDGVPHLTVEIRGRADGG